MRQYIVIAAILLGITPAFAQSYPTYAPVQQEANVTNYPQGTPSYPQAQPVYAAPAPQPAQQPYYDPRPSDAGQSVVTDVRQMNF